VAGDDPGELADVHLDEATADDRGQHGGRIAASSFTVDGSMFRDAPRLQGPREVVRALAVADSGPNRAQ
jgi:hypothetical protein